MATGSILRWAIPTIGSSPEAKPADAFPPLPSMPAMSRPLLVILPLAGLAAMLLSPVTAQETAPGSPLVISDSTGTGTGTTSPPAPAATPAPGQISSAPVMAPLKLDIARRDLKNFLTDDEALTPYRKVEGISESLQEIFVIGSNAVPRALFWDPLACRLIGVLDLEAPTAPAPVEVPVQARGETADDTATEPAPPPTPSPYLFMAGGAHPLTGSGGASGVPRYFGFRLVGGMPEFLYTFGALAVEERIWLEDDGAIMKQRFSVREASRGLQLTLPESWLGRVETAVGTWKKNVLSVPEETSAEVILTYRLTALLPEPAESN